MVEKFEEGWGASLVLFPHFIHAVLASSKGGISRF